jgi:4-hydroxyphenylpyruvate dioxygenase
VSLAPTSLRTDEDPDHPVGLSGVEFLEFSTFSHTSADALEKLLETLGFAPVARHRSKDILLFRQGDINLVLNRTPSSFAHSFATMHGTSVCAMAVRVADARRLHDTAVRGGAKDYRGPIGPGELFIPSIRTPSGSLIYFVDKFGEKGTIYDSDFLPRSQVAAWPGQLQKIDHISQSVSAGTTKKWLRFYSRLLGIDVVDHNCITDPNGRTLSTVLADAAHNVQLIINEPVDRNTDCDRYLRENFGEGVQHVAFSTGDIFAYLDRAQSRGLDVLKIPDVYYDNLSREGYDANLVDKLRRYRVMIDTEGGGQLLHAYTQPIETGVFFEFVQRNNHRGFGRHDVTARLMALEGVIQLPDPMASPSLQPDLLDAAVDGNTMLMGTVADCESQLLMPEIMGHWLGVNGINGIWLPFKVHPRQLEQFVVGLRALANLKGVSVAAPHKRAIVSLLDEITDRARMVDGVNVVRREADGRLVGDMVDGCGIVRGIGNRRGPIHDAAVWLVGSGVEGQAVAVALAAAGAHQIFIEHGTQSEIGELSRRIADTFPAVIITYGRPTDPKSIDIAINTSPLGRELEDMMPIDPSQLHQDAWVADIITRPAMTRLLSEAEALGHNICPGRFLLESQVTDYVEFFRFY